MLVLCLTAWLAVQAPEPQPVPEAAPRIAEEWDDARARKELRAFDKVMRDKRATNPDRTAAVEALARGKHARLVPAFVGVVRRNPAPAARRAAATALGYQPMEPAQEAIRKLLRDDSLRGEPELLGLLVASLDRNGYEPSDWRMLESLFTRDWGLDQVPLKRAILVAAENHREDRSLEMLVEQYGEPMPEDIDDPDNPPAEYWERRWKEWQVWRRDIRRVLRTLTGENFEDQESARRWLELYRSKRGG